MYDKAKRKAYREKNKLRLVEYEFARGLRRNYNLTVDEYNRMFQEQQGFCSICKRHQSELKRRLAVDHCHKTGQIRSLLCSSCNPLIGYAKESTELLHSAIEYINKFKK